MSGFSVGDRVVCIDSTDLRGGRKRYLTEGKEYEVVRHKPYGSHVYVVNDNGKVVSLYARRFRLASPSRRGKRILLLTQQP